VLERKREREREREREEQPLADSFVSYFTRYRYRSAALKSICANSARAIADTAAQIARKIIEKLLPKIQCAMRREATRILWRE
jgi:hypothetical protein